MKKRLFSGIFCLILVFAFFAGCDNPNGGDPDPIPTPTPTPDPITPTNWINISNEVGASGTLYKAAYGNDRWVISAGASTVFYSIDDGFLWTKVEHTEDGAPLHPRTGSGSTDNLSGLGFVNGKFLVTGGSSNNKARAFSANGRAWADSDSSSAFNAKGVAFGNGVYVVSGGGGQTAWSSDLSTWTIVNHSGTEGLLTGSGSAVFLNAVCFGNNVFVAGGGGGQAIYSTDGKSWEAASQAPGIFSGTGAFINGIAFGNGKFVVVGEKAATNGGLAWTSNGSDWTAGVAKDNVDLDDFLGIAYGAKYFVAVGKTKIAWSEDGMSWNVIDSPDTTVTFNGVGFGNGKFIAVGNSGKVYYAEAR